MAPTIEDLIKEFEKHTEMEKYKKIHKCFRCYWYSRVPGNMEPCYSCDKYDKFKSERKN